VLDLLLRLTGWLGSWLRSGSSVTRITACLLILFLIAFITVVSAVATVELLASGCKIVSLSRFQHIVGRWKWAEDACRPSVIADEKDPSPPPPRKYLEGNLDLYLADQVTKGPVEGVRIAAIPAQSDFKGWLCPGDILVKVNESRFSASTRYALEGEYYEFLSKREQFVIEYKKHNSGNEAISTITASEMDHTPQGARICK
jgi:hypothetical protein